MSILRSSHLLRHLERQAASSISATSSRNISGLPPGVAPLFEYASNCNITQGVQSSIEAIHGLGLPWATTIVASGIALRLATAPAHIYAEKLFAKRLHATNFFTQAVLKKLSEHFKIDIVPNKDNTKLVLKTENDLIHKECDRLITEKVNEYMQENRLQASRIQNLKMFTVPVWIFSSFAIRNIISSDFHPSIPGALWLNDLLLPDPYFVLPVAVGIFGFLNLFSQRLIYPVRMSNFRTKTYDYLLAFFTLFAVRIMMDLPACISLYWLTVSTTGMAQAMILRHPKVKSLLGIQRLPTDSRTPLRDLFLLRRPRV
uniref:Mitochondrial inner membrane protein COX18 n=1 Tax=Steinernema glaseri TaxID=37863 RepID=A0A1I7YID9_9BILA